MSRGAVASGDELSARAGCDVLAAGGNAVDAAVATSLLAGHTLPTMTGLGGGGVTTIHHEGRVYVLDHFATLPGLGLDKAARREPEVIFVPFEGVRLPFRVGRPTISVPGQVAGLFAMHERFGRMPFAELAQPTIDAARKGTVVTEGQRRAFALLEPIFRRTPQAWDITGHGDRLIDVGERMFNAPLADTLEALVSEGPRLFYDGEIGRRIAGCSDGHVSEQDVAAYQPAWREPLQTTYRGHRIYVPGVPSLSGAMMVRALQELEAGGEMPAVGSYPYWQRIAAAHRAGAALRTEDYETRLFEEGFLDTVVSDCPGGSTMQCSTIDGNGMAVSATSTVGEGCGFVIPGTGVMLNNFMGEEDILPPDRPWQAGARMATSMCPTYVQSRDGRQLAIGAAGSSRIRSAILQVLVHTLDGHEALDDAVERARIHTEGDTIFIEAYGRIPPEVDALKPLGSEFVITYEAGFFFGGVQAVGLSDATGLEAAADHIRRGCHAIVLS